MVLKISLTDDQGKEQFSAVDRNFDASKWIQGPVYPRTSTFKMPRNVKPGTYDLRISLVDDQGSAHVKLGIAGRDAKGRYKVGTFDVSREDTE